MPSTQVDKKKSDLIDAEQKQRGKIENKYYNIFACKNQPLIYLNMPKSSCTSIRNFMYFLDNNFYYPNPLDIHFDRRALYCSSGQLIPFLRKLTKREFTFTFVREPVSRVYSCYVDKIHSVNKYSFVKIRQYLVENYGLDFPIGREVNLDNHIANFSKFIRFVQDNLRGLGPIRQDYHWQLQEYIIRSTLKDICVDYIGIVENFTRDFDVLLQRAGIPKPANLHLDHRFNESQACDFKSAETITPELRAQLEDIYKVDIEFYDKILNVGWE